MVQKYNRRIALLYTSIPFSHAFMCVSHERLRMLSTLPYSLLSSSRSPTLKRILELTKPWVKKEKIYKGRILADFNHIWRMFGKILPLQKSNEEPKKKLQRPRKDLGKHICLVLFVCSRHSRWRAWWKRPRGKYRAPFNSVAPGCNELWASRVTC